MKNRILALLAVLALMLALVPAASAQDDAGCFGLSAEDCEVIDTASANSLGVTGFVQDFSVDFSLTGLAMLAPMLGPDIPVNGDITLNVTGSGPLYIAPDSPDGIVFDVDMDVELVNGTETTTTTVGLTLIDGMFYIDLGGEVVGIPQEAATEQAGVELGGNGATTLAELAEIDPMSMGIAGASTGLPPSWTNLITYERAGDDFTFFVDVSGILATDEIAMVLPMVLGSIDTASLGLGDLGDLGDPAALLPIINEALIMDMTVNQRVNSDLNAVAGLTFDTNIEFDLGVAAGSPGTFPPIIIELTFNVDLSDVNGTYEVVAPEGAEIIDAEDLDLSAFGLPGGE